MVRTFRRQPRAGRMAAVPPLAVLPLILLLLSGCDFWHQTYPDERREANFVAAYNYSLQGAYDDAVAAYHRALDANPNNAAAHWDLGFIYQEKLKDYAVSIYHFRRCQEIKKRRHDKDADDPTIENAIRQNQIQLAIQFASSLGHQQSQSQLDDLKRRNTDSKRRSKNSSCGLVPPNSQPILRLPVQIPPSVLRRPLSPKVPLPHRGQALIHRVPMPGKVLEFPQIPLPSATPRLRPPIGSM